MLGVSINRAGSTGRGIAWRGVVHCSPRQRHPRPPLVLNEAERSVLLLVLNSERFVDLAPAAVHV